MDFCPQGQRRPMATAPRNGLTIVVGHEDVGQFVMGWMSTATNELFAPGVSGMWETPDRSMTWAEVDGMGPDYWFPLPSDSTETEGH